MIYQGNEEILFESDEALMSLVQYYYILLDEITRKREPPLPSTFIKQFKDRYHVTLSDEEYFELKDYAENEFRNDLPAQIKSDFATGRIKELK